MRIAWLGLIAWTLSGCRNPCQRLCVDMAETAKEMCGLEFSKSEVKECIRDMNRRETDREDRQACEDNGPDLEEEWTCEEYRAYFNSSGDDDTASR